MEQLLYSNFKERRAWAVKGDTPSKEPERIPVDHNYSTLHLWILQLSTKLQQAQIGDIVDTLMGVMFLDMVTCPN